MTKSDRCSTETFKMDFEDKLKPQILKELNNTSNKAVFSEMYIRNTLNTRLLSLDNLYIKLRNVLMETELGISIKRKKSEFVFYYKSEKVNRESDILKVNFEQKLLPILLKTDIKRIDETFLKQYLNVDYKTFNLYQKLRNILKDDSNIEVSLEQNVKDGDKTINIIRFTNKKITEKLIERDNIIKVEEINHFEERMKYIEEERQKELKRINEIDLNILKKLPPISELDEFDVEIDNLQQDDFLYYCDNDKSGIVCNQVLQRSDKICPKCKALIKWDTGIKGDEEEITPNPLG